MSESRVLCIMTLAWDACVRVEAWQHMYVSNRGDVELQIYFLKHATSLEAVICFISAICLQGLSLTLISLYFPTGSIKQIPSNRYL